MDALIDLLLSGEVRVIFRKRENRVIRNLLCTLNASYIPPEELATLSGAQSTLGGAKIVVWDLESLDWRSFYLNSVITFDKVSQES